MPVVSLYPNGTSASVLSGLAPAIAPRGAAQGWTPGAARRNDHFLQSIDFGSLSGEPWALTLTIPSADAGKGHVPDSAEFHAMLQAMVKRLRRLGATRWHWVIEMTRRKTPHVHLSVWFSDAAPDRELKIRMAWAKIAARHGIEVSQRAQCVKRMTSVGWAQYTSKHGARGVKHYQRERAALPEGWRERPGRMWGYGGDWPSPASRQPLRRELGQKAFWRYRRLVRSWCLSNARKTTNARLRKRYIRQARHMLACSHQKLSPVKPINVWIPEPVSAAFLSMLEADYEARLVAVGGDLDAVADWAVTEYTPFSLKLQARQRTEFASAFHSHLVARAS